MTVLIFPSKLEGEALEAHETNGVQTLENWLAANVSNFKPVAAPPISIQLNDKLIPPSEWASALFSPHDTVRVFIEPKGLEIAAGAALYATIAAAAAAVVAAVILTRPKLPKNRSSSGGQQGDQLSNSTVKANQVKPNAIIREVAGRRRVYPDYLLPPHRYFSSPREQWLEILLCISKGELEIDLSQVFVGDTPLISFGENASFNIYGPGADLSADPAAVWWHSANEVGSTSTGTSGLDLTATFKVTAAATASAYTFAGSTVSVPSGAGSFPNGWAAGMIARIEQYKRYSVSDNGVISGPLGDLQPFEGMAIEIAGDNAGTYLIRSVSDDGSITLSYTDGSAAVGLTPTTSARMAIGYAGLNYRLTAASAQSISVERTTDTGEIDRNWQGFLAFTTSDAILRLDASTVEGNWAGPFAACPENEVTSVIEVDHFFPGGLVVLDKTGWPTPKTVTVELQYRPMGSTDAWTSVRFNYTQATLDQLGFTKTVTLPYPMRPEVRMRRLGARSTDTSTQDNVQWYGLRSRLTAPTRYEGVTTISLRIKSGGRLASQSENQISVIATRKLPDVTTGEMRPTRDIADWVAHVARSVGYTEKTIDLEELRRLDAVWSARGDYYDQAVDGDNTVKSCMVEALQAGFADLTIDRGLVRPVRDERRVVLEHMYTPQNMTEELSRKFNAWTPDDYDGVDVEYTDTRTWQVETVPCRLPGDKGIKVDKIRAEGVTDRDRAYRIGMRRRCEHKYRRYTYSFSTELDALNSRYLSYCALADDVPGYAQSALLLNFARMGESVILESSEKLNWQDGIQHVAALRRPDGTLSGPYPATRIDDYRMTVPLLDFVPDVSWSIEPPHLLFGPIDNWHYPVLVTSVSPNGYSSASVEAVNYDERVYQYDDATAPD